MRGRGPHILGDPLLEPFPDQSAAQVRSAMFNALEQVKFLMPSLPSEQQLTCRPVVESLTTAVCALLKGSV